MHVMAILGDSKAIELLVLAGAEVDASDKDRVTPLLDAIDSRQLDAVKALVANGANTKSSDINGLDALAHAEKEGYPPIILYLRERSTP